MRSVVLGLELRPEGGLVRFHDPAAGEDLDGFEDVTIGRAAAEARASAAEERARRLEMQLRRLGVEPEG